MDGSEAELHRLLEHIKMAVTAGAAPTAPGPDTADEDRAVLLRLAAALADVSYAAPVTPIGHRAVDRWLAAAAALSPDHHTDFADRFMSCAALLHWNTAYADLPVAAGIERFRSNYSYAALVAPADGFCPPGPLRSDQLALFLVVQGASVDYQRHHHPATEIYGVVSGTGWWLRGDEGYRPRQPGEVFVHQPGVVHATTTRREPTMSWVAWLDDLRTPATMV